MRAHHRVVVQRAAGCVSLSDVYCGSDEIGRRTVIKAARERILGLGRIERAEFDSILGWTVVEEGAEVAS